MTKELSLKELLRVIRKYLWIVMIITLLAAMGGYLYSLFFKPVPLYQSEARLVIGGNADNITTLEVMIKDPAILTKVSQKLNGRRSANVLAHEITASSIDGSQIVSISVVDRNPRVAEKIANTTATIFKSEAANILNFTNVHLLSGAKVYPTPINSTNHNKVIFGFVIGLIAGVGLALLLNSLDDTVRSEGELEQLLEAPVLGSISEMNRKNMYKGRVSPMRKKTRDRKKKKPALKKVDGGAAKNRDLSSKETGTAGKGHR